MRPGAELLLTEGEALGAVLAAASRADFDSPTVCDGWTVRDVLAHCSAALTACATGELHRFTPEDNERDVAERRAWPLEAVLEELRAGYREAAAAVDRAAGQLDGVALGEWMHGGEVREAMAAAGAYASAGVEIAVDMLFERSRLAGSVPMTVHVAGAARPFGPDGDPDARRVDADVETFVRLCGNRRPDPDRFRLAGIEAADLVLFT